jgi:hypothetical protein
MSTDSDSSAIPETYLAKAKQLLDDENVDEASRALFFSALQSYLAGDSQAGSFPAENAPVWAKVLKLVIKFIAKTPASPPTSPRSPGGRRTASEKIAELIRRSPQQSFQERVLGSPVKAAPKEDEGTEAEVPTLSNDNIEGEEESKSKTFTVEMTESDWELLQQKKKELVESRSKVVNESSEFKIDEVISLDGGD